MLSNLMFGAELSAASILPWASGVNAVSCSSPTFWQNWGEDGVLAHFLIVAVDNCTRVCDQRFKTNWVKNSRNVSRFLKFCLYFVTKSCALSNISSERIDFLSARYTVLVVVFSRQKVLRGEGLKILFWLMLSCLFFAQA